MGIKMNRVATTRTADGKSIFADTGDPREAVAGGMTIVNVWGTAESGATVTSGGQPEPVLFPFFPGPGGTRACLVHFPPASHSDHGDDTSNPEEAQRV